MTLKKSYFAAEIEGTAEHSRRERATPARNPANSPANAAYGIAPFRLGDRSSHPDHM
jgi:hypothetical protein